MGATKNSEICAKIIVQKTYSVFKAAFEIGDFIATTGGSSAASLLEGTKAKQVIDKFFSKHEFPCLELICERTF
jgi:hypothetical protein